MYTQVSSVRKGIERMFNANIGIVLCTLAAIVPFINFLAGIAIIGFSILNLIGLYKVGQKIKGCLVAFIINISCIIFSLIDSILGQNTIFATIDTVLTTIATLIAIASISFALKSVNANSEAKLGFITIAVYIITTVASEILFMYEDLSLIVFGILLSLGALVCYLCFLHKCKYAF